MSVRFRTTSSPRPLKLAAPSSSPSGTPRSSAMSELERLIFAVTPRMFRSSGSAVIISSIAFSKAVCIVISQEIGSAAKAGPIFSLFQSITPLLATKVRKVALSVRIYACICSAMTRHAPMPAFAEVYHCV